MERKIFDNSGNYIKEGALKTYSLILENFSRNFLPGKPYWSTRHDVTGSDFHYLPPYYSLAEVDRQTRNQR